VRWLAVLLAVLLPALPVAAAVPEETTQLLVVRAPGWGARAATLRRHVRVGATWEPVGDEVPVALGGKGLAWGRGLAPEDPGKPPLKGPIKREGDARTPAGLFRLTEVTGLGDRPPAGTRLPYRAAPGLVCVDDPRSPQYNRVVAAGGPWRSAEDMALPVIYGLTVFVDHNPQKVPGGGSCIFLHVWRKPGATTLGCTAMERADLEALLGWLDPAAAPALVVLPDAVYAKLRGPWRLPSQAAEKPASRAFQAC
jgi:zinc D-Ala-D-Ala dipeptidase